MEDVFAYLRTLSNSSVLAAQLALDPAAQHSQQQRRTAHLASSRRSGAIRPLCRRPHTRSCCATDKHVTDTYRARYLCSRLLSLRRVACVFSVAGAIDLAQPGAGNASCRRRSHRNRGRAQPRRRPRPFSRVSHDAAFVTDGCWCRRRGWPSSSPAVSSQQHHQPHYQHATFASAASVGHHGMFASAWPAQSAVPAIAAAAAVVCAPRRGPTVEPCVCICRRRDRRRAVERPTSSRSVSFVAAR